MTLSRKEEKNQSLVASLRRCVKYILGMNLIFK
jgi:hypothetical protein